MLPEKTWRTESVLRLLLGIFATWSIGILIVAGLGKLAIGGTENETPFISMLVGTVVLHGTTLLWIHYFLRSENLSWRDAFGLVLERPGRIVALGILGAILTIPIALLLQYFSWMAQQFIAQRTSSPGLQPELQPLVQELRSPDISLAQQIFMGFAAVIIAPVVEELIFRGILYPTIKRAGFPKLAIWSTSIVFALTHQNLPSFLPLIFFAMVLIYLYEKTGSLLAPIVAHSFFNATNFALLFLAKKFPQLGS